MGYEAIPAKAAPGGVSARVRRWRVAKDGAPLAVGAAPRWLNTSGLGVPWLHVRIDSRPKYITYRPYRDAAAPG